MGIGKRFLSWLGILPPPPVPPSPPEDEETSAVPPPPDPLPTLEIFAMPGHGKTSYLWSTFFLLRRLNLFWPNYVYWAEDTTQGTLEEIQDSIPEGRLPQNDRVRYDVKLQDMHRWGQKRLVVWDWPDLVFSPERDGSRSEKVNWNAPALWLVSLPDLRQTEPEMLDMLFDRLIRKRIQQGHSANPLPFRLVIVLTKGDSIPNLPLPLREYLKEDPLGKQVQEQAHLMDAQPQGPAAGSSHALDPGSMELYLSTLHRVHEVIQSWLESTLGGSMLIRRAREYHVDLRFAIVSSLGSGAVEAGILELPWTPRRVLDPLFWAFELVSFPG